jgi:hypothetical protein
VPDINAALQNLKGKAMFSTMDMRQGYYALRLDEKSRAYTTFITPCGAYQLLTLPTGAAVSPAYFLETINKILKYRPVLDKDGNPVFEEPNKVKLIKDELPDCFIYMDDVSCGSKLCDTYKETLDNHFQSLERIIERIAFHNLKLNVLKCEFAKNSILYLGWIVSHDFLIPDPRRMSKIKNAKFPESKKEIQSFLGLVNSIRRVIPTDIIREMSILAPLTSSKKDVRFKAEKKHLDAFEKIKKQLLSEPICCHLIDETATKYLFVDACTTTSTLGCTLLQRIENTSHAKILPPCLSLDDKVHRYIYDKQLPYQPCKLYTSFPIEKQKISDVKTIPPKVEKSDKWMGFTEENAKDSIFWSYISICAMYGCKIPESINELRIKASKHIKKNILGIKLKDIQFNNNHQKYRQFLQDFENGQENIDEELILARALAIETHRPFIFISTLEKHWENPVFTFNKESAKPPIILGLYKVEKEFIFTPYFYNKNMEFSIESLKGKVQIVAYMAKSVSENFKSRSILDF